MFDQLFSIMLKTSSLSEKLVVGEIPLPGLDSDEVVVGNVGGRLRFGGLVRA